MKAPASTRDAILDLKPYPAASYQELDLNRLTVFVIDFLEQLGVPRTLENIAVADFRLFPKRFCMIDYPEFPDISRVNRALLQLRPKYRNWATGKATRGWVLTPAGIEEARSVAKKLGRHGAAQDGASGLEAFAEPSSRSKRSVDPRETLTRIRASSAFTKAMTDWPLVSGLDVLDLLEAYAHTPPPAMRRKLDDLKHLARDASEDDLTSFLADIGKRFAALFQDK